MWCYLRYTFSRDCHTQAQSHWLLCKCAELHMFLCSFFLHLLFLANTFVQAAIWAERSFFQDNPCPPSQTAVILKECLTTVVAYQFNLYHCSPPFFSSLTSLNTGIWVSAIWIPRACLAVCIPGTALMFSPQSGHFIAHPIGLPCTFVIYPPS